MLEENIKLLEQAIKTSEKIVLINHIRMDPDAFGGLSAFYYILKELGKEIIAVNDEKRPKNFNFLDKKNIFETNLDLKGYNPDLIISFDAASLGQLGETYIKNKEIFDETPFFVIDHHITNPAFGKINIIDTNSSSTCELVFEILEKLELVKYITPKIATFLNAGILTDTNMYYNQNTTSKTLQIASKLLKLGSDFRSTIYEFFKQKTLQKTKLFGIALSKIQTSSDGKIVYTTLVKQDFINAGATDQDTNGIIDMMINIAGAEIAFIVYSLDKGGNKASFRSKYTNVGELCESFGGGGHKLAAGFSSDEEIEKIVENIFDKIKKI